MNASSRSKGFLVLLGLACWSLMAFALGHSGHDPLAQNKYLTNQPGEISVNVSQKSLDQVSKTCKLSPAEISDFNRAGQRIVDVIGLQPAAKLPRGVSLTVSVSAEPPLGAGKAGMPSRPPTMLCYVHFNEIVERGGKPVWGTDSPVEITFHLNDPERSGYESFTNGELRDSMSREIFYQPSAVGEAQGHRIYRDRRGMEFVILTRGQRPVWTPLTQEEFLTLSMRSTESQLKELRDSGLGEQEPAKLLVARLARHKAVLAAMSPAQRGAQAMYLRNENLREPDLAPKGSEEARPLVVVNPEWFDPSLPKSAIQLISVTFEYGPSFDPDDPKPGDDGSVEALRLWEMRRTIDWSSISSLLAK
jgi:hypothetical protein